MKRIHSLSVSAGLCLFTAAHATPLAVNPNLDLQGPGLTVTHDGVGLESLGSGTRTVTVDIGGPVVAAVLYWAGRDLPCDNPPGTCELANPHKDQQILFDGQIITGVLAGEELNRPRAGLTNNIGYRQDVTALVAARVQADGFGPTAFTLAAGDMSNRLPRLNGAGLLVLYTDGADPATYRVIVAEGLDFAFAADPVFLAARTTEPLDFLYDPSAADRLADLVIMVGDADANRSDRILISDHADVNDVLGSVDGAAWDEPEFELFIAAGTDTTTVQLVSPGEMPTFDSLTWIMSALRIMTCSPDDCDDGNACTMDTCVDGACVNEPVVCDSGAVCDASTGACTVVCPLDLLCSVLPVAGADIGGDGDSGDSDSGDDADSDDDGHGHGEGHSGHEGRSKDKKHAKGGGHAHDGGGHHGASGDDSQDDDDSEGPGDSDSGSDGDSDSDGGAAAGSEWLEIAYEAGDCATVSAVIDIGCDVIPVSNGQIVKMECGGATVNGDSGDDSDGGSGSDADSGDSWDGADDSGDGSDDDSDSDSGGEAGAGGGGCSYAFVGWGDDSDSDSGDDFADSGDSGDDSGDDDSDVGGDAGGDGPIVLRIRSASAMLVVTASDGAGNTSTCMVDLCPAAGSDADSDGDSDSDASGDSDSGDDSDDGNSE